MIKQISVFVENKKGRLAALTKVLADAGIDLVSLSIADTTQFGILRCIVSDVDKAVLVLKEAGFTINLTDVVGVCVPDAPGGLYSVLDVLTKKDISISYLYSFARRDKKDAVILIKVENAQEAVDAFNEAGIELATQDDVK